jgi:rhodanese-related sulfurtransferase
MKELEKTKRISIAATLFILIIIIALLAYKRPKYLYSVTPQNALEQMVSSDYFLSLNDLENMDYVLIDVRSNFEFAKGHLPEAINIYTPDILRNENNKIFKEIKSKNKTAVLYGANPDEANAPFMILFQLGFDNLKILTVSNAYLKNKLVTENVEIDKSVVDVNAFIEESLKKSNVVKPVAAKPKPKKVITVKKKKKAPAEGGC